jgi:hypothetical protein
VHHRTGINNTGGAMANLPPVFFYPGITYTCGKFATGVLTTPAANFATSTAGVVDTGGKFAISVNDTGILAQSCCQYQRHR